MPISAVVPKLLVILAWTGTLAAVFPSVALVKGFLPGAPAFLIHGLRLLVLLALAATAHWVDVIRPLRTYFPILMVLLAGESLAYFFWSSRGQGWLESFSGSAVLMQAGNQGLRILLTGLMLGILFLYGASRKDVFLQKGDLGAPASRVTALGIKEGESWKEIGRNFSIVITLVTLGFMWAAFRPGGGFVRDLLPVLPIAFAFAVSNSIGEEICYRAGPLSQLAGSVGWDHALWMTAVLFGLAHLQGVPGGVVGAILAGTMGWILAKSLLETNGIYWAWFIHFLQDLVIFSFILIPRKD